MEKITTKEIFLGLILFVTVIVFLISCVYIVRINSSINEQTKVIKEAVLAMQEQNELLKYNPAEEL